MKTKPIEEFQKTTIELKDRIVVLTLTPLDTDTNMDEFCKIQYHNIMGEILTSSVALNRAGNLLAEMDEILAASKLDFEIFEAQQQEKKRKLLTVHVEQPKGGTKIDKPTKDEVENAVLLDPDYKIKKLNLIKLQKNQAIINAWYWAFKDKCDKLNKITDKLMPNEFEKDLLDGKINGVMLKAVKKAIS